MLRYHARSSASSCKGDSSLKTPPVGHPFETHTDAHTIHQYARWPSDQQSLAFMGGRVCRGEVACRDGMTIFAVNGKNESHKHSDCLSLHAHCSAHKQHALAYARVHDQRNKRQEVACFEACARPQSKGRYGRSEGVVVPAQKNRMGC
jgi:hypothetical protein